MRENRIQSVSFACRVLQPIAYFLALRNGAEAQAPTPSPTTLLSVSCSAGDELVKIGSKTAVCLIINPLDWSTATEYSQISIFPEADTFSSFSIPGSWSDQFKSSGTQTDPLLAKYGENIGFHVESVGALSFQKSYRQAAFGRTYSIFTAIINVDKGAVTGITWDDGCHFCNSDKCEPNTFDYAGRNTNVGSDCFQEDESTCIDDNGNVSDICQLTVYVVWSGTDKNGIRFESQQKRLGLFAGPTVNDYLSNAQNTFNEATERLPEF